MKSALIMHQGSRFENEVIGPWLNSFSDLSGILVIKPNKARKISTLKHEYRRSGVTGLIDMAAFRIYYKLFRADEENTKIDQLMSETANEFESDLSAVPRKYVDDPNSDAAKSFLEDCEPDATVARCKTLLGKHIFDIPTHGTFVIHPGICPEYRNSHGCFWALAENDPENVGYSMLRIDEGIDTGPIYSQSGTNFDSTSDDHLYIQYKVVTDNLGEMRDTLRQIESDNAEPIDVEGRESNVWGQPKMRDYLRWKRRARGEI